MAHTKPERIVELLRGAPGCGKSFYASQITSPSSTNHFIVNRDAIRFFANTYDDLADFDIRDGIEKSITGMESALIKIHLKYKQTQFLIIDATMRKAKHVYDYLKQIYKYAPDAFVKLTNLQEGIDFETCVSRVRERAKAGGHWVPEGHIKKIYESIVQNASVVDGYIADYQKGKLDFQNDRTLIDLGSYTPDPSLPKAYIFDIDGTLAINDGHRDWYDNNKLVNDKLDQGVYQMYRLVKDAGFAIIIFSGRSDDGREQTEQWLQKHNIEYDLFAMRKEGDNRNDAVVKKEMFKEHIDGKYAISGVFDDRNRVVDMWRKDLGLKVFQVNYGDF